MVFLVKAAQLILSLSILIVLHELGHFIPARIFKIKVEKFYLFFNPYFSLFKIKKGDTEYGIGWLPLGGYVKIAGMIDESMDKEQMKAEPEPWEFRSKPAWQRLIVMLGGVTVNIILAIFIYAMVMFAWGDSYIPNSSLKDGVWVNSSVGEEIGFKTGDKIVSISGKDVTDLRFSEIREEILFGSVADTRTVTVDRNGELVKITLPIDMIEKLQENKSEGFLFDLRRPFIIDQVLDTSINKNSQLERFDWVVNIGGRPTKYFDQAIAVLDEYAGTTQKVVVKSRIKQTNEWEEESFDVLISEKGKLEVSIRGLKPDELSKLGIYDIKTREYSFLESFPAGFDYAMDKLSGYVRQFKLLFNFETGAFKGVGGFGAIGNMFPSVWNWEAFWHMTAFLSIVLAFMNVLPIPALDGGHAIFLFYEMIVGKKPSDKFLEYAQVVGMVLVLSLVVLANGNDIFSWIFK